MNGLFSELYTYFYFLLLQQLYRQQSVHCHFQYSVHAGHYNCVP